MKLNVRRLEEGDLEARINLFNDEVVRSQMNVDYPISLSETKKWYQTTLLNGKRKDFVFRTPERNQPVAMGGLVDIALKERRAEVYIVVNPSWAGKGIGSEAVRWLTSYGFTALGLHRIYLYAMEGNQRALSLYERLGYKSEGCLREHGYHRGRWVNRCIMGMLRSEWEKQVWGQSFAEGL